MTLSPSQSIMALAEDYLIKSDGGLLERPQFMFMRVAIHLRRDDIERVLETYHTLSRGLYTHGPLVLSTAGTNKPQYVSSVVYEPDVSSHCSILKSANAIDRSWLAGSRAGVSLGVVPSSRYGEWGSFEARSDVTIRCPTASGAVINQAFCR